MFGNIFNAFKSDFKSGLSSIGGAIKGAGSFLGNAGSNFAGAFGAVPGLSSRNTKSNTYTPPAGLNFDNPAQRNLDAGRNTNMTEVPNMSIAPNMNTFMFNQGQQQAASNLRPSTYTQTSSTTPTQSTPWQPTVDQFGRIANEQQGTPYIDAKGKLVVPKTNFSGMEGSGGSGFTSSVGTTGQQGTSGTGARGFAGAGQGTTSSIYGTQTGDEDERTRSEQGGSQTIADPTTQAFNVLGAQGQQQPPNTPVVPEVFAMEAIQSTKDALSQLTSSSMSEQDKQSVYAQLQNNLLTAKAKLDQANPIPEQPVVDTQDQLAFMESQADPFGVKQAIDAFRAEQTNLGELQRTRVETMKSIQALNEAYRPIVDEIKQNPNMPKALARRKIEALAFTQKETLQGFLDQLTIINQQVDDQNEIVNRAFDIVTFSEGRANRAQDNIRQNLQLFLDSGAIGGFTETELRTFAQAANMPYEALRKAKESALTPKLEVRTSTNDAGVVTGFDEKTGKILYQIKGIGNAQGGGGSITPETIAQTQLYTPTIQSALAEGASAEEAVMAAIAVSKKLGNMIDNKTQTVLLKSAKRQAAFSKNIKQNTASDPITSFLFNRPLSR